MVAFTNDPFTAIGFYCRNAALINDVILKKKKVNNWGFVKVLSHFNLNAAQFLDAFDNCSLTEDLQAVLVMGRMKTENFLSVITFINNRRMNPYSNSTIGTNLIKVCFRSDDDLIYELDDVSTSEEQMIVFDSRGRIELIDRDAFNFSIGTAVGQNPVEIMLR
jgi:hypothetical protein